MRLLRCHIRCHQQVLLIFTAPNHYNYTIAQKISRFVSYLHFCYVHFCQIMLHHLNYYITIILHILHDLHFNCIGQNCNSRTIYAHYHRFIFASGRSANNSVPVYCWLCPFQYHAIYVPY